VPASKFTLRIVLPKPLILSDQAAPNQSGVRSLQRLLLASRSNAGRCAVAILSVAAAFLAMPATARGDTLFVGNNTGGTIGEYTTSGAPVNASLISGLTALNHIAVSGSDLFVSSTESGLIGEYTTSGVTVNASLLTTGSSGNAGVEVSGRICLSQRLAAA
jgi:hypothetical protein